MRTGHAEEIQSESSDVAKDITRSLLRAGVGWECERGEMNEMAAMKIGNDWTRKCTHHLHMYHTDDAGAKILSELGLRSTSKGVRDIL